MKILREGDRGYALAPERGRVEIVYEYRTVELEKSNATVRNVLVGVDAETGEVLTVPAQSTPKLKAARDATKEKVMSVRMPRELDDVLHLVADHYRAAPKQFAPAVIRYYLTLASSDADMVRWLCALSNSRLATGKCRKNLRLRVQPELLAWLREVAVATEGATKSDLVRGAIMAAKEDVLDDGAKQRQRALGAIAQAV
ncbi:MAG: hypothetical protein F4Y74_06430 [Gemmatimonadales bacterium]|nr:hypothetical protein [Gemmatimonadales bacterium]MYG18824.1 hypothetical protein [Gemmatimonadales bacterium]MYH11111.1 hypothetical protein [Gemmatimonadales bacterium]MYL06474.1 hypothetical protein [Gemmatimonadales bacterium]